MVSCPPPQLIAAPARPLGRSHFDEPEMASMDTVVGVLVCDEDDYARGWCMEMAVRVVLLLLVMRAASHRTTTCGLEVALPLIFGCFLLFAPYVLAMDVPVSEHDVFFELHDRIAAQMRGPPGVAVGFLARSLAAALRDKLRWRRTAAAGVPLLSNRQRKLLDGCEEFAAKNMESYIRKRVHRRHRMSLAARGALPEQTRHDLQAYESTVWMKLYNATRTAGANSEVGRKWFKRFRIPVELFDEMVAKLKTAGGWVNRCRRVLGGGYSAPVELQLMITLRWLGRGESYDTLAELTGDIMVSTTVQRTVKEVTALLASFQGEFIRPPTTEEEIMFTLRLYEAINLPGCIGSTDGIQIPWGNVPHAIREMYKGKGGTYSLGYNMSVSRDLYCQSIGYIYAGSHNDITKAAFDPWIQRVRMDPKFKNRKFNMVAADGSTVVVTGLYLIGDRGYPRYEALQQPAATSTLDSKLMQMNVWLEASRKDVERFFGVLKSRWRILKTPLLLRDVADADNMVKSCVVLHNWYLLWRRKHVVTVPGTSVPEIDGDRPDGNFEAYNREERRLLQAAQRRPALRTAGTVLVDGQGNQVIKLVRDRVRSTMAIAGEYDASLGLTEGSNVRTPSVPEVAAAASAAKPELSEVDRHLAKQRVLAEHIAFHMEAGSLRWTRYELVPLLSVADIARWTAQIRSSMLRAAGRHGEQ